MFHKLRQKLRMYRYRRQGLQIADDCRVMGNVSFGSEPYLISIGRHVTISGRVSFITHDGATFVFRHLPRYQEVIKYGRITVHDNCFIGFGSIILPGITIGPNAVVAAHAVVTKDVAPNTVVGGNPAKELMTTEEYAEKMLSRTPDYDEQAYRQNKKHVLLQLYPYSFNEDTHGKQGVTVPEPIFDAHTGESLRSSQ